MKDNNSFGSSKYHEKKQTAMTEADGSPCLE
jgi:hypothetical protein